MWLRVGHEKSFLRNADFQSTEPDIRLEAQAVAQGQQGSTPMRCPNEAVPQVASSSSAPFDHRQTCVSANQERGSHRKFLLGHRVLHFLLPEPCSFHQ